jgi:hypothetical protein
MEEKIVRLGGAKGKKEHFDRRLLLDSSSSLTPYSLFGVRISKGRLLRWMQSG